MATITYEPSACNCNGTDYSTAAINAAATKALALAKDKKTLGDDKYPHAYNDCMYSTQVPSVPLPPPSSHSHLHAGGQTSTTPACLQQQPELIVARGAVADEHFTFSHANAPYLEFPILPSGAVYDGGAPGADRVVIGSIAADYASAVFCACLTHDGSPKRNGFVECKGEWLCFVLLSLLLCF